MPRAHVHFARMLNALRAEGFTIPHDDTECAELLNTALEQLSPDQPETIEHCDNFAIAMQMVANDLAD